MIYLKEYEDVLAKLGNGYFIGELKYVPDITSWAEEKNLDLSEPHNLMKLVINSEDSLTMVLQEDIKEENLDNVMKGLSVRWSLKDNVTNIDDKFNSIKKRLVFSFLKEYARALNKTDGDELNEDMWVVDEMDFLGFFNE